jgi:hypothetical protein
MVCGMEHDKGMQQRAQCPVCLHSIRLEGNVFVDHSVRTEMGGVRPCPGQDAQNTNHAVPSETTRTDAH